MSADKSKCPACGEPVYPTDEVCMSCGAELHAKGPEPGHGPQRPVPQPSPGGGPPPGPPAAPTPHVPIAKPWYHKVVESCGRLWDIYPWIGICLYLFAGLALHAPLLIQGLVAAIAVLWWLTFLFWLICDVRYFGLDWWWIIVVLFVCYPIGFLIYLWKRR